MPVASDAASATAEANRNNGLDPIVAPRHDLERRGNPVQEHVAPFVERAPRLTRNPPAQKKPEKNRLSGLGDGMHMPYIPLAEGEIQAQPKSIE
jgi:hypothetical protein